MRSKIVHRLFLFCVTFLFVAQVVASAAGFKISGVVTDVSSGEPLTGVTIKLDDNYLWAVTDIDGKFVIENIQKGTYKLTASYLGYESYSAQVTCDKDITDYTIKLKETSLALKQVVVTAQQAKDGVGTSRTLNRSAINHLQMSNMSDMAALLPGGKTINPDLTSSKSFDLRSGGSSVGNSAFGTALEVDGVRLGNNAGFGDLSGIDTRSISVDNIESVEVITGVPSAEYGDLNSGMVKINTRRGRTPLNVSFTVNPRTYQTSVSKGFDLQQNRGIVNVSGEWAKATKKLSSPYESYVRRGFTLNYSNTFHKKINFDIGVSGNIGGMNSEDDPDAYSGEYTKQNANNLRANTKVKYMLNKSWITNLNFEASVNYDDNRSHIHSYNSYASNQPAVHAEKEGYFMADRLPLTFFADQITDSKELDYAASLKYDWTRRFNNIKSKLIAGVQWKANGNVGDGEYYEDPSLAANGYRPRPYSQYPFMHNVSAYIEEDITFPLWGKASLELTAGLRNENVFIEDSEYDKMNTFSPRFNAKLTLNDNLSIRAGWGITEKLPSFHILYPEQEYRDIQTFGFSHGDSSSYIYYTQPYKVEYNPDLKWQRNRNIELGLDARIWNTKISLSAFFNKTKLPYGIDNSYSVLSYNILQLPNGFAMPSDVQISVDEFSGMVFLRDANQYWTPMDLKVTDQTFVKNTFQSNGADVNRSGIELTIDFPQIEPILTSFRLDASYSHSKYIDAGESYIYSNGWSHTSLPNRSYQYVGIYANGGSGRVDNGKKTDNIDANFTIITHIPQARLIVTCRFEASLYNRFRNLSEYNGADYAYTTTKEDKTNTKGNIYDGNSYTAIYPIAYMGLDGKVRPFTSAEASNSEFSNLIIKSGNAYTFAQDGYDPYISANLSVTKEIGNHVSFSFFANNFTNSRPYVKSKATGVGVIFTPSFYYGMTCRLKF